MNENQKLFWENVWNNTVSLTIGCIVGIALASIVILSALSRKPINQPTLDPASQTLDDLKNQISCQLDTISALNSECEKLKKLEQSTEAGLRAALANIAERALADSKAAKLEQAENDIIRDLYTTLVNSSGNYSTAETLVDIAIRNHREIQKAIDNR